MQYLTKAVTKMRKSKSLWTLKFRHRSSTGDHSASVIVHGHPRTVAPLSGIIETNQEGGAFCKGRTSRKASFLCKCFGAADLGVLSAGKSTC